MNEFLGAINDAIASFMAPNVTMKTGLAENIFLSIAEIINLVSLSFSRESLSSKLRQIDSYEFKEKSFSRYLKRYSDSGLFESGGGPKKEYRLTEKGLAKLIGIKFKNLSVNNAKKWDHNWRLIIFDVPEKTKFIREILRRKLKYCCFFHLQKSVFVFPYECEKEMQSLCDFLQIEDSLLVIKTECLGKKEEEIKKFFNL